MVSAYLHGSAFAQAVGLVAAAISVLATTMKDDRRLFTMSMASSALMVLHFALLGAVAAACSVAIICVRFGFVVAGFRGARPTAAFVAIGLGVGALTAHDPVGLIPVAASSCATVAAFMLDGVRLRLVFLATAAMWIVHDVAVGSAGGVFSDVTNFAIGLTTIIRLCRSEAADAAEVVEEGGDEAADAVKP
jgi:hypothetical protein